MKKSINSKTISRNSVFNGAYNKLNKQQKEAVDAIEGPVMVIAGPGTGKTQILSLRIANIILKTDTAPSSILAIAFTDSAVRAMRKRLVSIMGNRAYEVNIATFHSFANDRIQEFPDIFPRIIGSEPITDIEKINIIENILLDNKWDILKPYGNNLFYLKALISTISHLKREGIDYKGLLKIIDKQKKEYDNAEKVHIKGAYKGQIKSEYVRLKKTIEKNTELAKVFKLYEEKIRQRGLYDFEDMIVEVVNAMDNNKDFLLQLQERYQYVLIDEHQDTNHAQYKMVESLVSFHENPNVFIVGDEKQAIYRFQGASLSNFSLVKDRFKNIKIIHLVDNYRSTQNILDISHGVIRNNKNGDDIKPLSSWTHNDGEVKVISYLNPESEAYFVAESIKKQNNKELEEVAIIYRDNKDAYLIENMLNKMNIPFSVYSDISVFEDIDIEKFIDLCDYLSNPNQDELLAKILLFDILEQDPLDIAKIIINARDNRRLIIESLKIEKPELWNKINSLSKKASNMYLKNSVEDILNEVGFTKKFLDFDRIHQKSDKFRILLGEIESFIQKNKKAKLIDFIDYIKKVIQHDIKISYVSNVSHGVKLMTAHRSKGLEFDTVYIMGAYEGHWSNKRSIKSFDIANIHIHANDIDDERRLFYVAMTRAKRKLFISYPRYSHDGKELLQSQFIDELKNKDIVFEENKERVSLIPKEKINNDSLNHYFDFLKKKFIEQGLSVTAINAYLDCPWKFFFNNLLRIPRIKSIPELFGTAIHEGLKVLPQKNYTEVFESSLRKMPLSQNDFESLLKKGKEVLVSYYEHYKNKININTKLEYRIETEFEDITVKGNIDRIEFDEQNKKMTVIDYKTGPVKSRNHIIGNTKNSNGDYFRQLVFYKFLLENDRLSNFYSFNSGIIDFVEKDEKGFLHREEFEIKNEDVETLKKLVKDVKDKIYNLDFIKENHRCENECEFCNMAEKLTFLSSKN